MNSNDLSTLLPEFALTVLVLIVLSTDLFLRRDQKWLLTPITVIGLGLVGLACWKVWGVNQTVFAGFYRVDDLSVFFKVATVVIGILAALFAPAYLAQRRLPLGEFNTILLFSLIGMFVLASSSDLITLFVGLELMVMPAYLLAGFHKTDRYSNEGGLKYFLLGSFASAILLFGISWTYGLTGTTSIDGIAAAVSGQMSGGLLVAIAMLTVGATFKAAAVPFHYWTPDAYQGAPTPITGFLSVGPKLGAFALLIRVFAEALAPLGADWLGVFLVLTGADHDGRQRGRPDPGQREADARLLEHRPHRLHHGRPRRLRERAGPAHRPAGHSVDPLLRPRLRGHEHRRVLGGRHAAARHRAVTAGWTRSRDWPRALPLARPRWRS